MSTVQISVRFQSCKALFETPCICRSAPKGYPGIRLAEAQDNHDRRPSGHPVSRYRFGPGTSTLQEMPSVQFFFEVFVLQGCYEAYVGSCLPTFRDSLSAPIFKGQAI